MSLRWAGSFVDRLLLLLALTGIAVLWWQQLADHRRAVPMVSIWRDRTLLACYPLQAEKTVDFTAQGAIGETRVHIANGYVSISHSSCRSQRCVRSGQRHHMGAVLACVPNHILVSIEGQAALDAIAE